MQGFERYETVRLLGRGGMGSVDLARDRVLDRLVAVKRLRAGFDDEAVRLRFAREARLLATLQHPNVVSVFDYFEHEGDPFLVMEFIEGETLRAVIAERQPWSLLRKLEIAEAVCAGLESVHRAGIIHRDVKPANLMVTRDGIVKLLDFGVAKSSGTVLTLPRMLLGSPNYMSPEQIRGEAIDARSDVFALTAVFYELLAFASPFPGDVPQAFHAILHGDPPPLGERLPDVPPALERLLARGLAKDRGRRIASAAQLGRELANIRAELAGATTLRPGQAPSGTPVAEGLREDREVSLRLEEPESTPTGRRLLLGAASAVLLALLAILVVPHLSSDGQRPASPALNGDMKDDGKATPPAVVPGPRRPAKPPASKRTEAVDAKKADADEPRTGPDPEVEVIPTIPLDVPRPGPVVEPHATGATAEETQIREVLDALQQAHNDRQVPAIKSLYPTLSQDAVTTLDRTFLDYRSYTYRLSEVRVQVKGAAARVVCRITRSYTLLQGDARNVTANGVISLHKIGDVWEISDIVER